MVAANRDVNDRSTNKQTHIQDIQQVNILHKSRVVGFKNYKYQCRLGAAGVSLRRLC